MKRSKILLGATLVAAIALPVTLFAAKGGGKKKDRTAVATFASADKNSDGSVSKDEYVAAMKDSLGEDGARAKFAILDKNDDKKLSKEEYDAGGAAGGKKRKKKK